METLKCEECGSTEIGNEHGEYVCKNCGLVFKDQILTFGKHQVMLKSINGNLPEYKNKIQSTPTYRNGSIINSSDSKYKRLSQIHNNITNDTTNNRVVKLLLEINSQFHFSRTARNKILQIFEMIKNNVTKNFRNIDILALSIVFYTRQLERGYNIKYIIKTLKKTDYNIPARRINNIIKNLPSKISKKYPRATVNQKIDFCITRIFNHIREKYKDSNINFNKIQKDTRETVETYVKLRQKLRKTDSSSYNAFICKIIYDKLKHIKVNNDSIIIYNTLEDIIKVAKCTIRNVDYKSLKPQ